jgi:hypothetical protein
MAHIITDSFVTLPPSKVEISFAPETHDILSRMVAVQEILNKGETPLAEWERDLLASAQPAMRRFRAFRRDVPENTHGPGTVNPADEPQFEGVVFSDGTVCVRWLTAFRSHSLWDSWDDLDNVHGHPEYGSYVEWLDD